MSTGTPSGTGAARREALFTAGLWVLACGWTVGFSAFFGYRPEPAPRLILGMPAWVFGGIVAPWLVCTVVTCWFALRGIRDEDLGRERPVPGGSEPEP